jgi:hypothetical protein
MQMAGTRHALAMTAMLLLAGCSGGSDVPPEETNAGSIQGHVLDEGRLGIEGANVSILLSDRYALTDATGAFDLDGVEAGAVRLAASFTGHLTVTRTVTVPAGGALRVDFVLPSVPTTEPFFETLPFSGTLACGLPAEAQCAEQVPEGATRHAFEVRPALKGVVIELQWQSPAEGLAEELALDVRAATPTACGEKYAEAVGSSPLRLEVAAGFPISGGDQCIDVLAAEGSLTVEQDYTLSVSLFYHEPPPAGFTALP